MIPEMEKKDQKPDKTGYQQALFLEEIDDVKSIFNQCKQIIHDKSHLAHFLEDIKEDEQYQQAMFSELQEELKDVFSRTNTVQNFDFHLHLVSGDIFYLQS